METNIIHLSTCAMCGSRKGLARIVEDFEADIRGEKILVERTIRQCVGCGERFSHSRDPDWILAAFAIYRERVGMVSPESLRTWREAQGLSQVEASALLGWSEIAFTRFERGSLMSAEQDQQIRACMSA